MNLTPKELAPCKISHICHCAFKCWVLNTMAHLAPLHIVSSENLLNHVGCVVTWVTRDKIFFYVDQNIFYVGCVGQKVFAGIKFYFKFWELFCVSLVYCIYCIIFLLVDLEKLNSTQLYLFPILFLKGKSRCIACDNKFSLLITNFQFY